MNGKRKFTGSEHLDWRRSFKSYIDRYFDEHQTPISHSSEWRGVLKIVFLLFFLKKNF